MRRPNAQRLLALPLALTLALGGVAAFDSTAFAEGDGPDTTSVEPSELQQRVESSAVAYNEAAARVDELQQRIDENSARISEIEEALPAQQEKADAALVSMYKLSGSGSNITDILMGIQDLDGFLTTLDYLGAIAQGQLSEIDKLQAMQRDLNAAESELRAEKAQADEAMDRAGQALAEAQAAREEIVAAMAASITDEQVEAARQQMVDQAAAQAAEQAAAQGANEEEAAARVEAARAQAQQAAASVDAKAIASGGVDWSMDKGAFVSEWSSRIDTYLEGSPLEGQGSTFASAAWDYGVDPRWSPAIANTESTKGEYTFAEHNAWGWGSSSWDSWEDAINDHVKGLADGYGSTITEEGAAKYCPPNADYWYSSTLDQMNKI